MNVSNTKTKQNYKLLQNLLTAVVPSHAEVSPLHVECAQVEW